MMAFDAEPMSTAFIVSGCLSIVLSALGLLLYGFGSGPHDGLVLKAFWLGPLLAFPGFLIVIISRKWHRIATWMLAILTFCGEYGAIRDSYLRGHTILTAVPAVLRVPIMVVGCLDEPQVLMSIAIAVLVDYDYRRVFVQEKSRD